MTTDRIAAWLSRAMVLGAGALITALILAGYGALATWPLLAALACAVILERDSAALPRARAEAPEDQPKAQARTEAPSGTANPGAANTGTTQARGAKAGAAKARAVKTGAVKVTVRKRVLIVGAGVVGRTLAESLEATGRYEIAGFVDDEPVSADDYRWKILGGRDITADIVAEQRIDEVILAHGPSWKERLTHEMMVRHPEVSVRVVPTSYEALLRVGRVESHGDIAVADLVTSAGRATEGVKRLFDVVVATTLLILSLPAALLAAAAIKLTSPGPVIFSQERVGRYGKAFTLFKFRTMVADAEAKTGPVLANGRRDSRLTRVGKLLRLTRMDEVPQLWNVLRGEMSLVGPRPERPAFVHSFEQMNGIYALRHQVRPGITGLAQICGGYHTSWRDKLRFDLIYVSHQSPWLDISILFRTVMVCILPRGHEKKEEQ